MRRMLSALATYSFSVGYILNHFQCEVYKRGAYLFVQKKKGTWTTGSCFPCIKLS